MDAKKISLLDLEENFEAVVDDVADNGEVFYIENEEGSTIAVLVPYDDYKSILD